MHRKDWWLGALPLWLWWRLLLAVFRRLFAVISKIGHRDFRAVGKHLARIHKIQRFHFHDKANDVTAFSATKAMVKLPVLVNGKGGRFFVMKGTTRPKSPAALFDGDIGADDFHDIRLAFQLFDKVRIEPLLVFHGDFLL